MNSQNTQNNGQANKYTVPNPQENAAAFFDSFARLVKISTYYPPGHEVFLKGSAVFLSQMKSLPLHQKNGKEILTIAIRNNDCTIAGITVDELSKSAEDVRLLFFRIGIYQIDFNSKVSPAELQKFVTMLMEWKMHSRGAKTFTFFSGTDFPKNITISQQQFTANKDETPRSVDIPDTKSIYSGIGRICRTLVDFGYSKEEAMLCRDFLVKAVGDNTNKSTTASNTAKDTDWNTIINLLINFLDSYGRDTSSKEDDVQTDLNALSNILETLAKEEENKSGQQAISMLMDLFTNEADPHIKNKEKKEKEKNTTTTKEKIETKQEKEHKRDEEKDELRISPSQAVEEQASKERAERIHSEKDKKEATRLERDAIKDFVSKKEFAEEMLARLSITDNSEELSILLQLLIATEERDKIPRLISHIQSFFNRKLSWREKEVIFSGLTELSEKQGFAHFYTIVKGILETIRSLHADPPLRFMLELHAALPPDQQKLASIFLINEALQTGTTGSENNKKKFITAIRQAASLNQRTMNSLRSYLEQLPVFKDHNTEPAEDIFIAEEVLCYPLYSFLLETSIGAEIGAQVLVGLKQKPQDVFISHIAPLIRLHNKKENNLLKQYLFYRPGNALPRSVENAGANMIVAQLQRYNGNDKNDSEDEHVAMIEAIGKFGDSTLIGLMENICNEKKMGMFHLWSAPCRQAAQTAIYSLKRRS